MKKELIVGSILFLGLFLVIFPFSSSVNGQDGTSEMADETSKYPQYGFGAQFISPSGGLSSRIWLNPQFGFEGNAIFWSTEYSGLSGTSSLRLLYKLTEDSTVDFYVAGGGAYNIGGPSNSDQISVVGTGGISLEAFSENFVLNLEFGMQAQSVDRFGVTFGSGFHYYF